MAMNSIKWVGFPAKNIESIKKKYPQIFVKTPTVSQIDTLIKYLMKTGQYENLRVYKSARKNRIFYSIEATFAKTINKINLSGYKQFSRQELLDALDIRVGQKFDLNAVKNSAKQIKDYYAKNGYLNASVQIKNELSSDKKNKKIDISYYIIENSLSIISKIIITSQNKKLNDQIEDLLDGFKDQPLSESQLKNIRNRVINFFSRNKYIHASLSKPQETHQASSPNTTLIYKIDEPYRYDLNLSGNRKETARRILKNIQFKNYYRPENNHLSDFAEAIRNYYLQKGYAQASVTSTLQTDNKAFTKAIFIKIREGQRVKIRDLLFKGNFSRKPSYYKNFILTHSGDLIEKGYYNRNDLQKGFDNLQLDIQNQGYLRSQISISRIEYNKKKDKVTILIDLKENELTRIGNIRFVNNTVFSNEKLEKRILIKKDTPLQKDKLEESLTRLSNFYKDHGYLEMALKGDEKNLVIFDKNQTHANLVINIHEGPQIFVGKFDIRGNKKTLPEFIINELEFSIGDKLTPDLITESIERLRRTGLFYNINIYTLEKGSKLQNRTIVVDLKERQPGLFTVGMGVTNERTITGRGFMTITYLNLDGLGKSATFKVEGNRIISTGNDIESETRFTQNEVSISHARPQLFTSRLKGYASLSRSQTLPEELPGIVLEQLSTRLALSQQFSNKFKASWILIDISENKEFSLTIRDKDTEFSNRIAYVGPQIEIDNRNHPLYATSGDLTRWELEYGSPIFGSSSYITYIRSTFSTIYYTSFYDEKLIWTSSLQGGYLENLNPKSYVPYITKGFTLGGSRTIRGLESQYRFPNNQFEFGLAEGESFKLKTQSSFYLFKSELRFPLWSELEGTIFYDGGSVFVKGFDFQDTYRDAVGVGIRYRTPVGALTLDLGYNLDRKINLKTDLSTSPRTESQFAGFLSFRTY